jgi:Ca2+-binding RTX toxin-like protein
MATYTGTSSADTLSETTFRGDTLVGRAGDDTYHCWASFWYDPGFPQYGIPGEDVYYRTDIVEEPNRGYDTAYYHLGIHGIVVSGAELPSIERIYLINNLGTTNSAFQLLLGAGAQNVVGSTLGETISGGAGNDTIVGARGADSLIGGDGADTLLGGTGGDTLDGGAGLDRLVGGEGNDIYHVKAGDSVRELAGEGKDTINASADYTLPAGVENLVLGSGNIDGAGNGGDNLIYAGTGSNALAGGAGLDTVSFKVGVAGSGVSASLAAGLASGGSGNDTLSSFQNLEGTLYADTLQGNAAVIVSMD